LANKLGSHIVESKFRHRAFVCFRLKRLEPVAAELNRNFKHTLLVLKINKDKNSENSVHLCGGGVHLGDEWRMLKVNKIIIN
jgi:hypothetical protein